MKQIITFAILLISSFAFAQQHDLDKILTELHWTIERSQIDTVKTKIGLVCKKYDFPCSPVNLKDGKYRGETPADDYQYKHIISFEVKNGKIISLDYNEIHPDGHAKQEDKAYCAKMKVSGTTPAIAYPVYEKSMLQKQNLDQIDAVSGATYSLYRFKLAFWNAVKNSGQL